DEIAAQPTDDFPGASAYGTTIYSKAALGFGAIRDEIGDDAFFAALNAYYEANRFGVAAPDDLLAAFETASNEQLDELWRHWFEAAEGDQDYGPDDVSGSQGG
ncbi:MAG: M1 family aminopeptidase, partial [Thermomicrobiales bacterium]